MVFLGHFELEKDSIAVARNSRSRTLVTGVNLRAFMDGGKRTVRRCKPGSHKRMTHTCYAKKNNTSRVRGARGMTTTTPTSPTLQQYHHQTPPRITATRLRACSVPQSTPVSCCFGRHWVFVGGRLLFCCRRGWVCCLIDINTLKNPKKKVAAFFKQTAEQ